MRFLDSHSSVTEDSSILGCYAVSFGVQFLMIQTITGLSFSWSSNLATATVVKEGKLYTVYCMGISDKGSGRDAQVAGQ